MQHCEVQPCFTLCNLGDGNGNGWPLSPWPRHPLQPMAWNVWRTCPSNGYEQVEDPDNLDDRIRDRKAECFRMKRDVAVTAHIRQLATGKSCGMYGHPEGHPPSGKGLDRRPLSHGVDG